MGEWIVWKLVCWAGEGGGGEDDLEGGGRGGEVDGELGLRGFLGIVCYDDIVCRRKVRLSVKINLYNASHAKLSSRSYSVFSGTQLGI